MGVDPVKVRAGFDECLPQVEISDPLDGEPTLCDSSGQHFHDSPAGDLHAGYLEDCPDCWPAAEYVA